MNSASTREQPVATGAPLVPGPDGPTRELPTVPVVPHAFPAAGQPLGAHGQAWQRPPKARGGRFLGLIRKSPLWLAPAALLTCFAGAATYVVASNPTDDLGPTTCAFKLVTGFDCPGCGGTRAFYYLLTLNLPEAARNHAIALFAAPFLAYLYLSWSVRRVFPKVNWRIPEFKLTPGIATWFMAMWGVFWVVRNLPWAPFTSLYV